MDQDEFPHPNAARCLGQPARDNLIKAIRFKDPDTNRWRRGTIMAIGISPKGLPGVQATAWRGGDQQWVAWDEFEFIQ